MKLAIFGKKKSDESAMDKSSGDIAQASTENKDGSSAYMPEKAAKFFEHASAMHDSTNYEYATQLWLDGVRQDPTSMWGLEGFFKSAAVYASQQGKKGPSKDLLKAFSGRGDLERYLRCLLDWAMRPTEAAVAVRAALAASKINLNEPAYWIAERALRLNASDRKPRKDLYLKLTDVFSKVNAFSMAVKAGDAAVKLDPTDGQLSAYVRNLSAQATMTQGGYENTGEEGGFRSNIRDAQKQKELVDEEKIVKTGDTLDRLVLKAEEAYKQNPDDMPLLTAYAKHLLERGRPEDEQQAIRLYNKGFESSQQFRFRQLAGDIRIRQAKRKLRTYRDAAASSPDDQAATQNYAKAKQAFLKLEIEEFTARVEAYPTDLAIKLELGKRLTLINEHEQAIPLLQEAQHDVRIRSEVLKLLGFAFHSIGYQDEAIQTFRGALDQHADASDAVGMELSYGLLISLQTKATEDSDLELAKEAEKIASSIAIQQFNFKDVRTRRESLKKLIAELKDASS